MKLLLENWREYLTESTIQDALLAFMSNMVHHHEIRPADVKELSAEDPKKLKDYIKTHNHMIDNGVLFKFIRNM